MTLTRRSVLRAGAVGLGTTAVAGCLSDVDGFEGEGGYAAFFALYDWSRSVAGDAMDFENSVGVGESGHGWSPPGTLSRDVASSRVFVYLDSPQFAWAQDLADTLERDYADQVLPIDVLEDVDLLGWDEDVHAEDGHDNAEDGHDDAEGGHTVDDGHDHDGDFDPHVWTDPVRVQTMVRTIEDGLVEIDPDNEAVYAENADAYVDRVSAVDDAFRTLVESADRDVVVHAGHDSFRYLESRYGFDIYTPVGVSPDEADPDPSTIADAAAFVDDRGIDTVLYDAFETPDLAERIVEASDATDVMAISPAEGTTREWHDQGWGWVEQMERVNLPAFRAALGGA